MTASVMRKAATLLALACLSSAAWAFEPWTVPEADARVRIAVRGDLYSREQLEPTAVVDFNDVLGADRALADGSLIMTEADTGAVVVFYPTQDAGIRYGSGNPILRLQWSSGPLQPLQERAWYIYMRTVSPRAPDAWKPLSDIFAPATHGALFFTSLEVADARKPEVPAGFLAGGVDKPGEQTDRVWSDSEAHSGSRSLKIARTFEDQPPQNTNRPFWWTWPPSIPVQAGGTYQLSAWLKSVRLEGRASAGVYLQFTDAENRRMQQTRIMLRGGTVPQDWQFLNGSATAPPGAKNAIVSFSLSGSGEAYCDDIAVAAIPGSALPDLQPGLGVLEERSALAGSPTEAAPPKVLTCGVAEQPPKLDGVLDDPCWERAGAASDFLPFLQMPGTQVATKVLACADQTALYFGFECTEPSTDNLVATAGERDGPVWRDDSVELFLDTNLDRRSYYQIIVNSKGIFFDQDTGSPDLAGSKWNGPIRVATKLWPDRWTAELVLEFAGLRLAEAEGQQWGVNFARSSLRGGRSCYSWVKVTEGFGEPAKFGRLILPFDPTANAVTGRPLTGSRVFWGEGALPFQVQNRRQEAVEVQVVVSLMADGQSNTIGQATATVPPLSSLEVPVPCNFAQPGEVKLHYALSEQQSGKLLYETSVTHDVPEPLDLSPAALVSYLHEQQLHGTWTLGMADIALSRSSLVLGVFPRGGGSVLITETITPKAACGSFSLAVGKLPVGEYKLRASLMRDGKEAGSKTVHFQRIQGPFG